MTLRLHAALLLAALAPQAAIGGTLSIVPSPRWVHVAYVDDGDTFRTDGGTRVRLLGINAPEVAHRDSPGQPYGRRARRRLRALIGGRTVRLETDRVHRDVYGRLLAHVYRRDGTWIEAVLVREGLAHAYIFPPNFRHAEALLRQEQQARRRKLGIWTASRFRVLSADEVSARQAGQFRLIEGHITHVASHGLAFRLGRLHVSIPRAYRRYFPQGLHLSAGEAVRVRGVLRISNRGRLYLALHSSFALSKIMRP